ncbi:MAG: DHH family phosphoesterase [Candidatus Thermoplasmatota archaeon]|nr:DHH family phosphoesterase [Candidatus Thermoplasmatota archaeon]
MLIIHHWDTDGICSAAKIVRIFKPEHFINMTPEIGEFEFDEGMITAMRNEKGPIFVLDLNITKGLDLPGADITFIDHHQPQDQIPGVRQVNPVKDGANQADYPSCSTVVSETYSSWDDLSVLGAFGDVGIKALDHPLLKRAFASSGRDPEEFQRAVRLLDSSYVVGDKDSVEASVRALDDIDRLLEDPGLNANVERIRDAMRDVFDAGIMHGRVMVLDFEHRFNIISKLARKAVSKEGCDAALAINRDFNGRAQTYLRIRDPSTMDMGGLIRRLKAMGFNAGGKDDVVGVVHGRERVEELRDLMFKEIYRMNGGN